MIRHRAQILPLAAATPEAIPELAAAYAETVSNPREALADICFSAGTARTHHPWRLAVVGHSRQELAQRLRRASAPSDRAGGGGRVAFVFSGTGQERSRMGRRLLDEEPVFVRQLERCEEALSRHVDWSLLEEITAEGKRSQMNVPEFSQPALWALQVSLAALWRSWGIEPHAVIGHSMGEVSACTVAGALALEDAAKVMVERSRLATSLSGLGATAAVTANVEVAEASLEAGDGLVGIAADNGPGQTVISGDPDALERVLAKLESEGVSARRLDIPYAVHSAQLRDHAAEHGEALAGIESLTPELPVASTLTGRIETEAIFDGAYWARNVSEPVLFRPATCELADDGFATFVELGAHPVFGGAINRTLNANGTDGVVLSSLARDHDDREALLASLARLYAAGADVRWEALHGRGAQRVQLPRYRWQREQHWLEVDRAPRRRSRRAATPDHPLLGQRLAGGTAYMGWERSLGDELEELADHIVLGRALMPGTGFMATMAAAAEQAFGAGGHEVRDLSLDEALVVDGDPPPCVRVVVEGHGDERTCKLMSKDGDDSWTTHATAIVVRGEPGELAPAIEPVDELRARCEEPIDARRHYAELRGVGLAYGDRFRLLGDVAVGDREAVGELAPGSVTARLDAALQLVAAMLRGGADDLMLPVGAERVRILAPLTGDAVAYAHLPAGANGGAELRADVEVADPTGTVLAEVHGLRLRRLAGEAAGAADLMHELTWVPAGDQGAQPPAADVVVIAADEAAAEPLVEAAQAAGHRCRVAADPASAPVDATHLVLVASGDAPEAATQGALAFTAAVQRLLAEDDPPQLVTVSSGLAGAAVLGMARTVPIEHPELRSRRLDLRDGDVPAAAIVAAALAEDDADELALGPDGTLERPELRRLKRSDEKEHAAVRSDRTYLVTGGLGGVGLQVAGWLADRGAGRIVLTARREPGEEALRAIEEIEARGATVTTRSVDVVDREALAALLEELRGNGPPLGGIVHAAGALQDGALMSLEPGQVEAVLAPKVLGAWNLSELTAEEPLELFVLMSSIAGVIGAPGQAHYGGANAALDALARHRAARDQAALSVQWGPWAGAGMAAQSADRFRASGLEPLHGATALEALDRAIASGRPELLVAGADWPKVRAAMPGRMPGLLDALAGPAEEGDAGGGLAGELSGASKEEREQIVIRELRSRLAGILGTEAAAIDPADAINRLGLDSLMAIELRTAIERSLPVTLPLTRLLDGMTVDELARHLVAQLDDSTPAPRPQPAEQGVIVPAPEELNEPFPLNEIQVAYWMGRRGLFPLGTVSAHIYAEVDVQELDSDRFTAALRQVIERHATLRTVVRDDGTQQVLEDLPPYEPVIRDVRDEADPEAALTAIRDELSHQVIPADRWPIFEFAFTRIDATTTRVHVSLDMLIVDAASALMLGDELVELYEGGDPRPPLSLAFRDYAMALERPTRTPEEEVSWEYWTERLKTLPPAPELPLAKMPDEIAEARFSRRAYDMDAETWTRLRERASAAGLTPSALLCAAYAEVLAAWSTGPRLTINLTTYQRFPLHPEVNELIGDFTALTMLGLEMDLEASFEERAQALSRQLVEDLEHRHVNGVTLLRELVRTRRMAWAAMPIVFTSTLTQTSGRGPLPLDQFGELAHIVTQTPQVWLDFQLLERDGVLSLSWDVVDDLFPPGLIDDMFAAYTDLIERLASDEDLWHAADLQLLPPAQLEARAAANATEVPTPPSLLHEPLWQWAERTPDAPAVIACDRVVTYAELADLADRWAARLVEGGVSRGELVAVAMHKGWEQVVAVMAILRAGAAYLPVDPALPAERQAHLFETGGVSRILTQSAAAEQVAAPAGADVLVVDEGPGDAEPLAPDALPDVGADDLSYVIFTSGSTGLPKGVTIRHGAAMNTILDCNRRWDVTERDRAFAISSLGFDLSVYDVFGMIAAGGAVVIPDASRAQDPAHWAESMRTNSVSIWNSVPALMTLLAEHLAGRDARFNPELRTVMLSGDWIPLGLPESIKRLADDVKVISLGGATEAAIWSIFHEIDEVLPDWKSIPYGKPLANQRFHVLDEQLNPRPTWVRGDLFIAGDGLAVGYWGDEERTAAAFFEHPRTGERLYRTGDTGRYLPDGSIEFLGRLDGQVKVNGYRIELGEIESHLEQHPGVARAVVAAPGPREERRLAAYVVPSAGGAIEPPDLRAWLQDRLPSYMVPLSYTAIEDVPLNANGKVDRKALEELAAAPASAKAADMTEAERETAEEVSTYVAELLGIDDVGLDDDLMDLGFDSLRLLRLVDRLEQRFGARPEIGDLFRISTVGAIAAYCSDLATNPPAEQQAGSLTELLEADSVLEADIVPSTSVRPPRGTPERVLLTGATGFLGSHLLDELVRRTDAKVHCLVRAPNEERAAERLARGLEGWGMDELAGSDRWVAVPGDLAAPELGLASGRFDRLATTMDAIYHCAGLVNFAYPYERLRASNVLGTREVLRLSGMGGGIPVNHVSTTGVVPHLTLGVAQLVPETDELPPVDQLETAYTASKWVAEHLVASARERGLPVRIFRPGLITGHSRTGVCNPQDALWTVLRGALETGCAPEVDIPLFAAPVDFVAAAIVGLGRPQADGGDIAHLVAPFPLSSRTVFEWLRASGRKLELAPYADWRERLGEHAQAEEDEALKLLVALLPPELPPTRELLVETRNAVAAIEDPDIPSPILEADHVSRYADYLTRIGFWPEPSDLLVGT